MGFPLMVYRDGRKLDDFRIVANEQEKADAADAGYLMLDMRAFMAAKTMADAVPVFVEPEKPRKGRK
jgi:hypothetical protein